jgi:hypothetical protein
MKVRIPSGIARLPFIALALLMLTLTGCLLTGEATGRSGLFLFGSLTVDNDQGVFVIPEAPQQHFRGLRFVPSSYPVEVYRVVVIYRGGQEQSYAVNWRFTDRVRHHDLRLSSDRVVHEVRIFQKQPGRSDDKHGQSNLKGKGDGGEKSDRGQAGPVSFTVYGVQ